MASREFNHRAVYAWHGVFMKKVIIAGALVVFGLLGLWFFARPAYKQHKETRALEQARGYLAKGDYRNASLSARQTLGVNPRNLEACRIMAELAERSRSPAVLDWRRRMVELAPTVQNKLMLASTALRCEDPPYPLAVQTLDELKGSAGDVATYHTVLAELALRLKRLAEAAAQFEQASRLEPTNELHQLNLAVLQLQSTNAGAPLAARATLERLRASANIGTVALRWLVADSLGRDDLSAAARFSTQLLADPRSMPDDRLQHLTILQRSQDPEFNAYLSALQRNALTNAAQVYGVSAWMIGHGLAGEALAWLTGCPAKLRAEQPVPLALVNCYLGSKDWQGLDAYLQKQKWSDLEFLRFAFLSRATAQLNQRLAAEGHWRASVRLAGDRLGPLTALLGMATSWGRDQAREDLLWQIAQRFPKERWGLRELERLYLADGNTYGLNKVYSTMASYAPTNFAAQNNVAATSLLLKLNLRKAHELAKEVFAQHPDQAIVASTYAFSLHLQGRTKEGLAVLQKLKPEAVETSSVALYYGLLLSATGETNKAGKYLDIAQRSSLLPEEKALAAEAVKQSDSGK
jgi:Tfp pilus assembly protein PilF